MGIQNCLIVLIELSCLPEAYVVARIRLQKLDDLKEGDEHGMTNLHLPAVMAIHAV